MMNSEDLPTWPYPTIIAHRGGGKMAPENTLAAIDTGARYGHTMIEFDVKLSHDLQPFLLHDDTLDRTTNSWGEAGLLTWAQLKKLDAGSWFSHAFHNEPLPLLSEVAQRCFSQHLLANVEIKPTTGQEEQTGIDVALAVQRLWAGQPIPPLLSSFSLEALEAARKAAPELPRGLLLHEWNEEWQKLVTDLQCLSIHINHHVLTEERVAQLKAANLYIMAYTVNQPDRAKTLLNWGVDSLCTDRIDLIGPDFHV